MGRRGPAKQPQRLIDLKGYAKPSRARAEAVIGDKFTSLDQVDAVFDYSKLTQRGQIIFLRTCTFLIGLHVLEAAYLDDLLLYAESYDIALKCMWHLHKEGLFVGGEENPALRTFDKMVKTINSIGTQYGLTPASRQRLQVEQKNEDKPDIMDIATDAIEV